MPSSTRTITLEVPKSFSDAWLEHEATPDERGRILKFACSLPRCVDNEEELHRLMAERASEPLLKQNRELTESLQAAIADAATARAELKMMETEEAGKREFNILKATEAAQLRVAEKMTTLQDDYQRLLKEKAESDQTSSTQLRTQMQEVIRLSNECATLRAEVTELKTPAGRGKTGEFAIAEALEEMGFEVEDTSCGTCKDEGYHDLIVRPSGKADVRIAIECKNKLRIDAKQDLKLFEEKTRQGIAKGLFDTAIFVSLRCHTKKAEPHVVEMYETDDGHATIPISFVGPERNAKGDGAHLARETLQAHVSLHSAMFTHFSHVTKLLCSAHSDEDAQSRLREFAELCGTELSGLLDDLNQQSRLMGNLLTSIRSARLRAVKMITRMSETTQGLRWMQVKDPPWMPDLRLARDKILSGSGDALVWKNMSDAQKKRANDFLGRESFFRSAHFEAKRMRSNAVDACEEEEMMPSADATE